MSVINTATTTSDFETTTTTTPPLSNPIDSTSSPALPPLSPSSSPRLTVGAELIDTVEVVPQPNCPSSTDGDLLSPPTMVDVDTNVDLDPKTMGAAMEVVSANPTSDLTIGALPTLSSTFRTDVTELKDVPVPTMVPEGALSGTGQSNEYPHYTPSSCVPDPQNPKIEDFVGADSVSDWADAILEHLQAGNARLEAVEEAKAKADKARRDYEAAKALCERDMDDMITIHRLAESLIADRCAQNGLPVPVSFGTDWQMTTTQEAEARGLINDHHIRVEVLKSNLRRSSVKFIDECTAEQSQFVSDLKAHLSRSNADIQRIARFAFGGWVRMVEVMMTYLRSQLDGIESTVKVLSVSDIRQRYMSLEIEVKSLVTQLESLMRVVDSVAVVANDL